MIIIVGFFVVAVVQELIKQWLEERKNGKDT